MGRTELIPTLPTKGRGAHQVRRARACPKLQGIRSKCVSSGTLRAIDLLPARNRRPDIVQSRLFTGLFHLQWGTPADKLSSCTWSARQAASDAGSGAEHEGKSSPQGCAGFIGIIGGRDGAGLSRPRSRLAPSLCEVGHCGGKRRAPHVALSPFLPSPRRGKGHSLLQHQGMGEGIESISTAGNPLTQPCPPKRGEGAHRVCGGFIITTHPDRRRHR
jgi:hypothetical protein